MDYGRKVIFSLKSNEKCVSIIEKMRKGENLGRDEIQRNKKRHTEIRLLQSILLLYQRQTKENYSSSFVLLSPVDSKTNDDAPVIDLSK